MSNIRKIKENYKNGKELDGALRTRSSDRRDGLTHEKLGCHVRSANRGKSREGLMEVGVRTMETGRKLKRGLHPRLPTEAILTVDKGAVAAGGNATEYCGNEI